MKKIILLFFVLTTIVQKTFSQELVGAGQTYATLKAAFDDINAGNLTGAIELQITSSTTSATDAALNASGVGFVSYSSIKIYPVGIGGYTIDENIVLIGSDNITIDGRVNMTGSTRGLTITGKGATGSAITLNDGALNNQIQYLHLIGGNNAGIVQFGNTSAGSNFNKVSNCLLEYNSRNQAKIAMLRSAQFANGIHNHHDTIINNEFKNIFCYDQTVAPPYTKSAAILLNSYTYSWHIEGNSFYDEGFIVATSNRCSPSAISISRPLAPNQAGHAIVGNYIGGSQALCQGSPLSATSNGTAELQFVGINIEAGTDTALISNNLITNISLNNNKSTNLGLYTSDYVFGFIGISCNEGNIKVLNNTIGGNTGTNLISNNVVSGADTMIGILVHSFTANPVNAIVKNNIIGGISSSTAPNMLSAITGIYRKTGTGYTHIENNTIGSVSTPNSVHATSTTLLEQTTNGILISAGDSCKIIKNTISNLTNESTNTISTSATGIRLNAAVKTLIQENTVASIASAGRTSDRVAVGILISIASSLTKIKNNIVRNIKSTNTGIESLTATGIYTNYCDSMSNNFVLDISTESTGAGSIASGIAGSASYINNNIITMGTSSRRVYGFDQVGLYCANNTVYIGGDNSNYISTAYNRSGTGNNYVVVNNIFINNKQNSSGTTSRHYCIIQDNPNAAICNYNNYYAFFTSAGAAIARANAIEYSDFATYATAYASGQNANSTNIDPQFLNMWGNEAVDFMPTAAGMYGVASYTIPTDHFGNMRTIPYVMGALQSQAPLPVTLKDFKVSKSSSNQINILWTGLAETNFSHYEIECRLNSDLKWDLLTSVSRKNENAIENNYQYNYAEYRNGILYYRIKMIDIDGSYTYSEVKNIKIDDHSSIKIYPNPAKDILKVSTTEPSVIKLYAMDGHLIRSIFSIVNSQSVDLTNLTAGTYIIEISNNNVTHRQFIQKL